MSRTSNYVVARPRDGAYRLDRTAPSASGPVATIVRVAGRTGQPLSWRLRPHVMLQGARSKLWRTRDEALASTKLMTPGEAKCGTLARTQGLQRRQRKELLNDVLIYLTAAKAGLPVLTANRIEFDLIQQLAGTGSFIYYAPV